MCRHTGREWLWVSLILGGIYVAIASQSPTADIAKAFLNKLNFNSMFVAQEIYSSWTHKTNHFQRIHSTTGVPFHSMLFFDDENRNIQAWLRLEEGSRVVVRFRKCVQSGYRFLMDKREESAGSSSAPPFPWTKIWSANRIPCCKEFVWRACHDIIPVLIGLQRKKIQLDSICPLCGEEPETTEHAILYCSQVAPLWFASQLGIAIDRESRLALRPWLQIFLNQNNKDATGLILTTMNIAFKPLKVSQQVVQQQMVSWVRPGEHVYKANVDAAILKNSGAGLGAVFRNSQGEVMAAATHFIPHMLDLLLAEALAIEWAMRTAMQLLFTKVVFEADNQVFFFHS
ncbi:Reverse transcriptase zinc-binding domain [Sesbania bispinosa]|nr:Reverse transcriptase zinc-binding domain [Sesbania bispinosa]